MMMNTQRTTQMSKILIGSEDKLYQYAFKNCYSVHEVSYMKYQLLFRYYDVLPYS